MLMPRSIAFPYYGGKQYQSKWIISLLPTDCDHYVEPYCGGASVLLNKPPAHLETINDISGDVVNFFKVLRDHSQELVNKLYYTPYSREELQLANLPTNDSIERARRFYVRVRQSVHGTSSSWRYAIKKAGGCNPPRNFLRQVEQLHQVVMRLRLVQIENRPAINVIKQFDRATTIFYCDPPYLHSTRTDNKAYKDNEMSEDDHKELADLLLGCKAKVAISGYRSPLYDELYSRWQLHEKEVCCRAGGTTGSRKNRIECLWTNYV